MVELHIRQVPNLNAASVSRNYLRSTLLYALLKGAGSGPLGPEVSLSRLVDVEDCEGFAGRGRGQWRKRDGPPLRASEHGYRIGATHTRSADLKRQVNSLLNKVCPDNLGRIVEQMARVSLASAEELELVISVLFQAAIANTHYVETYTDMVFALRSNYPEFPTPNGALKARPISFTRILLNTCQQEFESITESIEPSPEDIAGESSRGDLADRRKARSLATMRFIGHLFLRDLITVKVLDQILSELLHPRPPHGESPEERTVECACELLTAVGCTLENTPTGRQLLHRTLARLADLKKPRVNDGGGFPKRIQFRIDDLLDLQRNGWKLKIFHERARTLDDIRKDAIKEWSFGGGDPGLLTCLTGTQPAYMVYTPSEPAPEPAAARSPASSVQSPLDMQEATDAPETLEASEGGLPPESQAFGFGLALDRAFAEELLGRFVVVGDHASLRRSWRAIAPGGGEATQGIVWLLEGSLARGPVAAEHAVGAVSELIEHGQLTWEQLSSALGRLVNPDGFTEAEVKARVDGAEGALFCAVLARTLRTSLFSPHAFHGLPVNRDLAWCLLVGTLRLVAEQGGPRAQRLVLNEFWEVICAVRAVPSELSERELLRVLVCDGALDEAVAAQAVL